MPKRTFENPLTKLDRARRNAEREIIDGCNDCKPGGFCHKHYRLALDMTLHPLKYIDRKTLVLKEGWEKISDENTWKCQQCGVTSYRRTARVPRMCMQCRSKGVQTKV